MTTPTRKMGANRGARRLWLEGAILVAAGFPHGTTFLVTPNGKDALLIVAHAEGPRRVAGTPERPIIDINSDKLLAPIGNTGDTLTIACPHAGLLFITNSKE